MARKDNLDLIAIAEHLAFTDDRVLAFYILAPTRYDFVSDQQRMEDLRDMSDLLSNLSSIVEGKTTEYEMWVIKDPISATEWAEGLRDAAKKLNGGDLPDAFHRGLRENFSYVKRQNYSRSRTYISVELGKRKDADKPLTSAPKQAFSAASSFIDKTILGSKDQEVGDKEIDYWLDRARPYNQIFQSYLAKPALGREIAALYRRPLYPAMTMPPLPGYDRWGKGDIFYLSESVIHKKARYNRIESADGQVGYCAILAFQKFPVSMTYPSGIPWIIFTPFLDDTSGKYTFWSKFSLTGANKVKKELNRIIKITKDEERDALDAGQSPLAIAEKVDMLENLEYTMSTSDDPWVYGDYFITVTGETPTELSENIQTIIQEYRNRDIILSYPTGKWQYALLKESLPGGERVMKRYRQRQPVPIIGGGAPTVNSSVGD